MFPLRNKIVGGYRQGQKTDYNNWHLGTDWKAYKEELRYPADGTSTAYWSSELGWTILFTSNEDGMLFRFGHLSKIMNTGWRKKGELAAITGNSGSINGHGFPFHLHNDISKNGKFDRNNHNNFLDPEKFKWYLPIIIKENNMIIRHPQGEIAYLSSKGYIKPLNLKAWQQIFDSEEPIKVEADWYDKWPKGQSIVL